MHGSNVMNQYVVKSPELRRRFDLKVCPLRYVQHIDEIGRVGLCKLGVFMASLLRVIMLTHEFRPHLVYFVPALTGFSFVRDCVFALVFKSFGSTIIYHLHGKGIAKGANNRALKRLYKWFFRNEFVIQLSPMLYCDIREVVCRKQVYFLPNGIDMGPRAVPIAGKENNNRVSILFLSNLERTKGPIVLLEACRLLKRRGIDFRAKFVGNPTTELTKAQFTNLIYDYHLEDRAHYLGPMYGREKEKIYSDSTLFVFPTYYEKEAFPLVLLEAMAFGLPVISTYEGAIPEIVDDGITGFLVPKKKVGILYKKIAHLAEHPEDSVRMGRAGRQKFEEKYRVDEFRRGFCNVIDSITAEVPDADIAD